jgi:hypothetical protein|tara:strand:+ start:3677 stop:4225 length:549 start_codon:yes stop_codon:yes gene_type:complete
MNEWLQQFVNPTFMPHGHCYLWRPDILWTHVISDAAIGISYYLIPIVLGVLIYKRQGNLPHKDIFALFIAFIFFCGSTHFVQIYITWYPLYEYQGWLKALTAFTSVLTVLVIAPKLPQLIRLSSIEEDHQRNLDELRHIKAKNEQMNSLFSATLDREENIIKLKKEVNALLLELNREQQYEI